jgi:hypothetical protein
MAVGWVGGLMVVAVAAFLTGCATPYPMGALSAVPNYIFFGLKGR